VDGADPPAELLWKKNLALLLYLALSPRQTRTREHLIGLLWGDKPESAARHSLNEALRVIRRAVGEGALQTDATTVRLDPDAVALDLADFTRHEAAGEWAAAAALVGGTLLEGFGVPGESEFEDWLVAERSQWERKAVSALVRAAEQHLASGGTAGAITLAERASALAPASGQAAGVHLRALALSGNRTEALSRFAAFTEVLQSRLNLAPDTDLAALADRIRRGRLGPAPDSEAARVALTRRLPLAGREQDFRELTTLWQGSVASRRTSVAIVRADAGIGKTRLVEELMARVALEGGATLRVRGAEADRVSPWSGLIGLARGGLLDATGIAAAPATVHAAFAAHIAEWGDRFRAAAREEPAPLARAFTELVRSAADEQPVLVVADDAHFLDLESLQALASLPRDVPQAPILLLLTAEPINPSETLDTLQARLGRDVPGVTLSLGPLPHEALRGLSRAVFPEYGDEALERLTRRVAADSAGVPLLAVDILHAVSAGLDLDRESGFWPAPYHTLTQSSPGDLPDTVRSAIRIGYRRLSEGAQRVLAAAAALGGRVTPDRVGRAVELPQADLDAALDELEWQRWLAADGQGYVFVAGIVERVIEQDMLTPGQRRRFREKGVQAD
jgi:DNA-binding SARP family transcriptional activator